VLVGVAWLTFLVKAGGGLYWLIPAAVTSLLGGVVNAWLFLVRDEQLVLLTPAGKVVATTRDLWVHRPSSLLAVRE